MPLSPRSYNIAALRRSHPLIIMKKSNPQKGDLHGK
nr:MAG TPA: hypothetical protein [Caudoviricetes sp.]